MARTFRPVFLSAVRVRRLIASSPLPSAQAKHYIVQWGIYFHTCTERQGCFNPNYYGTVIARVRLVATTQLSDRLAFKAQPASIH